MQTALLKKKIPCIPPPNSILHIHGTIGTFSNSDGHECIFAIADNSPEGERHVLMKANRLLTSGAETLVVHHLLGSKRVLVDEIVKVTVARGIGSELNICCEHDVRREDASSNRCGESNTYLDRYVVSSIEEDGVGIPVGVFPRTKQGLKHASRFAQRMSKDVSIAWPSGSWEGPLAFNLPVVESVELTMIRHNDITLIERFPVTPFESELDRLYFVGYGVLACYGSNGDLAGLYANTPSGLEEAKSHGARLLEELNTEEMRHRARTQGLCESPTVKIARMDGRYRAGIVHHF